MGMSNHFLIILFVVLFVMIPTGMGARLSEHIDCTKMVNIKDENCKLWLKQAGRISFILFILSIGTCLIIGTSYFNMDNQTQQSTYYKQAVRG